MRLLKPVPPIQQKQSDGMIKSVDSNLCSNPSYLQVTEKRIFDFFLVLEAKISVKEL